MEKGIATLGKKTFMCEDDAEEEWTRFQKEFRKNLHLVHRELKKTDNHLSTNFLVINVLEEQMIKFVEAGWAIEFSSSNLAKAIVEREYELQADLKISHDKFSYEKSIQGTLYHLSFLTEALKSASLTLFYDYIVWAKIFFLAQGISSQEFEIELRCMQEILLKQLPPGPNQLASGYLEQVLSDFSRIPEKQASFIDENNPLMDLARKYLDALLRGDRKSARRYIMVGVDQGVKIIDIYFYVFQCVLREIGQLWQTNQISIAQEHYCSAATQLIMGQLYPQIISGNSNGRKLILACVSGEQHEIGARMLSDFFEMDGWDVYYVGANTPAASIIEALTYHESDILALSATMTWHVSNVRETISLIRSSEQGKHTKIIVGGYPFIIEPNLWRQVGADAFALDAQDAINVANNLYQNMVNSKQTNHKIEMESSLQISEQITRREFFGRLNFQGMILDVVLPYYSAIQLHPGQDFFTAYAQNGKIKALTFWMEVMQKGQAIHWDLPLPFDEQGPNLYFDAIHHHEGVFLAIASSKSDLTILYATLIASRKTPMVWQPILSKMYQQTILESMPKSLKWFG